MINEELFKKNLSDKLESKEFPFDESNWEKASALIDASKERKRRFLYWSFAAGLLITTGIVVGVLFSDKNEENKQVSAQVEKSPAQVPVIEPEKQAVAVVSKADEPQSPESSDHAVVTKRSPESSATPKTPIPSPEPILQETEKQPLIQKQEMASAPAPNASGKEVAAAGSDTHGNAGTPSGPALAAPVTAAAVPPIVTEQPTASQQSAENSATVSPAKEPEVVKEEVKPVVPITAAAVETNTVVNQAPEIQEPVVAVVQTPSTVTEVAKVEEAAPIATSVVARPDTDYVPKWKPTLMVEAGTAYMLGWKTNENKEADGFTPVLGINYLSRINPEFAIGVGLHYGSVRNLKNSSYTSKISRLNFGEESEVSVYTPSTLHYLVAPLRVDYKLNEKTSFGMALNLAYLLTVSGKLETYNQNISGISNYQSTTTRGYDQGFKKLDTQLAAFYKRRLYDKIYGKVELFYGLSSINDGTAYPTGGSSRNYGLKFTLVYDIFDNY